MVPSSRRAPHFSLLQPLLERLTTTTTTSRVNVTLLLDSLAQTKHYIRDHNNNNNHHANDNVSLLLLLLLIVSLYNETYSVISQLFSCQSDQSSTKTKHTHTRNRVKTGPDFFTTTHDTLVQSEYNSRTPVINQKYYNRHFSREGMRFAKIENVRHMLFTETKLRHLTTSSVTASTNRH